MGRQIDRRYSCDRQRIREDVLKCFVNVVRGKETYKTKVTSAGSLHRQVEADRAEKTEKNKHTIEGELGRGSLLFSKVGDVYLYVDNGKIKQVRYG